MSMSVPAPPAVSTPLLTEVEFADALRVTDRTVRRWAQQGIVSPIRIGGVKRYRAQDLDALIAAPREPSPPNDVEAPGKGLNGTPEAADVGPCDEE
jgi:hypothetical protein